MLGGALAAVAFATLFPEPGAEQIPESCLICGAPGTADVLLNLVLFVPLGIALTTAIGLPSSQLDCA